MQEKCSLLRETEFKAILRLVRCGNEGLECASVFVFPKLDVSRFIGKIDITFDELIFVCKLSIYSDISAAISSITEIDLDDPSWVCCMVED